MQCKEGDLDQTKGSWTKVTTCVPSIQYMDSSQLYMCTCMQPKPPAVLRSLCSTAYYIFPLFFLRGKELSKWLLISFLSVSLFFLGELIETINLLNV